MENFSQMTAASYAAIHQAAIHENWHPLFELLTKNTNKVTTGPFMLQDEYEDLVVSLMT